VKGIALTLLVACGGSDGPPPPPAPIVNSMTPTSGTWGTQVTIDGANFGAVEGTTAVAFAGVGAAGFVVDTWNPSEITGRVAFPATGDVTVQSSAGTADAGTFTTSEPWAPSAPLDVTELDQEVVLSTGDVAALYSDYELASSPTLAVFSGSAAGAYPLDDLTVPFAAQLVEADDHTPEAIATKPDGTIEMYGVSSATLTSAATGLTGTVLAAGRDATGVYAWINAAAGVERARPGTTWTIDRGPFAPAFPPVSAAIAADGTLWIAVSEPAGTNLAYVSLQTLAPAASSFAAIERADPTSYADAISQAQITIASDGVHVLVAATADAGGTSTALTPRLRTAAATWSDAPAVTGLVQYAFIATTLAAIVNDAQSKTTSLVPDVTTPATAQLIPVWPVQSDAVIIDAAGAAHPLISNGDVTYALAPPS
jgi:hypothetical protein